MNFDFSTYMDSFLDKKIYEEFLSKKESVLEKLKSYDMTGWIENSISKEEVNKIKEVSSKVSIRNWRILPWK